MIIDPVPEPTTAQAADKPCELYVHKIAPRPSRTQGHHRHPVYLQNRVYGKTQDTELMYLCGLCHDSVHDWVSYLLGEAREPNPNPGFKHKAEARRVVGWYNAAKANPE